MPKTLTISIFGVTIPVSRKFVAAFSVVALLALIVVVYRQLYPVDLVTLQQANHALGLEIQEYGKHLGDTPIRSVDAQGLTLRIYEDKCLLIQRPSRSGSMLTKLVPDLERADWQHYADEDGLGERQSAEAWTLGGSVAALQVTLMANSSGLSCLNPHPGEFATAYGQRNGCWVEVWRRWPDGCEHVQMLNTCSGAWDSNTDGSPRVRWTRCVH